MASSTRPYLGRAIWEWCNDNGLTPLLQVTVTDSPMSLPMEFVQEGRIVLNISVTATRHLVMDHQDIRFSARFNGASREVVVPWSAVEGIFARETGEGMMFPPEEASPEGEVVDSRDENGEGPPEPEKPRPSLKVVK